ncbi:MAG: D-alanyl-D-alanine carboxypeptidase [Clostridiales bacterium]|nr:D-alanyl-D-alanine carboxypeptidase [Clostridiales bacterium]
MAEHVEAAEVTDANEDDIAVSAPASSELYSSSCAVMDGYSGRILYGKSSDTAMANASTTKILTCILALEYGNLSDTVTASARAAGQPKVRLGMSEGDSYVLEDLLYCLMLESYNDCAVAIAEHISGSVEAFADLMNEKAAQIGCKDTYFITPNGLDDEDENGFHHTTAEDLCLIMRYCTWESSKCKAFLSITQTAEYTFTDSDGISHTASNHNSLLTSMDGAITGKTGYTNDAGYCYVMAYEKDGRKFCVALLACGWPDNKNYKWKDANTLISYAVSAYTATDIYQEPRLPVITVSGSRPRTPVLSDWGQDVSFAPELAAGRTELIYMISAEDEVSYNINIQHSVDAPIMAGDAIGYYSISVNGETVCEYAICATAPAYAWTFAVLLRAVFSSFAL